MSKKNRRRIEELERQVAHLDAMVRHYIALYERGQITTTPTIVPSRQWPNPIPAGGINIPFPYPLDSRTTSTPLPIPPYRVTCATAMASEPILSSAWLSLDDDKAWDDYD